MLDTDLVERADYRALEQAPDVLDAVGMNVTDNPLIAGMTDAFVPREPQHCGISIAVTVEMLWKARAEIARLRLLSTSDSEQK